MASRGGASTPVRHIVDVVAQSILSQFVFGRSSVFGSDFANLCCGALRLRVLIVSRVVAAVRALALVGPGVPPYVVRVCDP